MRPRLPLLAVLSALAMTGCSTYLAKTKANSEMEALCRVDGGVQIFRTVALSPEHFQGRSVRVEQTVTDGSVIKSTVAGRYELHLRSETLHSAFDYSLRVVRNDQRVVDARTGDILAVSRDYCRIGGDSIALHPTRQCCPALKGAVEDVFIRGAK